MASRIEEWEERQRAISEVENALDIEIDAVGEDVNHPNGKPLSRFHYGHFEIYDNARKRVLKLDPTHAKRMANYIIELTRLTPEATSDLRKGALAVLACREVVAIIHQMDLKAMRKGDLKGPEVTADRLQAISDAANRGAEWEEEEEDPRPASGVLGPEKVKP